MIRAMKQADYDNFQIPVTGGVHQVLHSATQKWEQLEVGIIRKNMGIQPKGQGRKCTAANNQACAIAVDQVNVTVADALVQLASKDGQAHSPPAAPHVEQGPQNADAATVDQNPAHLLAQSMRKRKLDGSPPVTPTASGCLHCEWRKDVDKMKDLGDLRDRGLMTENDFQDCISVLNARVIAGI